MIKMKNIVGIIGLGYVGRPLAYLVASNEYEVIGIDTDIRKINDINNRKKLPIQLKEKYETQKYKIKASSDYNLLKKANIIIICVPTPTIDNKPDLSILNNVVDSLAKVMKKNTLLIVESTIAPGMTQKFVENKLNEYNFKINIDYDLAYCPERIDPGNKKYWVGNINRVCGASSKNAQEKAIKFYKRNINAEIISMNSIEEAELVKVWENSIRNTYIAQANLLAKICDKKNYSVKKVIEGLKSKTEQFIPNIAHPGIGPGGHCIPEDIHYLIQALEDNDIDMNIFKESVKINESMPNYALNKLINIIQSNKESIDQLNITMLGISYKPNSNDMRKSQAKVLLDMIKEKNPNVNYFDPIVDEQNLDNIDSDLEKILEKANVIILGCSHDIFKNIDFSKYKNIRYLLDCWNKYDKNTAITKEINYIGIGE